MPDDPIRWLTVAEAVELSRELYEHVSYLIRYGCFDVKHPNWMKYGLPQSYMGQELRVIDPFIHHLLPGKS